MYIVDSAEYINMRRIRPSSYNKMAYYVISDRNNCVMQGDYLVAYSYDNCKRVRFTNKGTHWKEFFNIKNNTVVITERPTVESLAIEGKKKLDNAAVEKAAVVEELFQSGEKALRKPRRKVLPE